MAACAVAPAQPPATKRSASVTWVAVRAQVRVRVRVRVKVSACHEALGERHVVAVDGERALELVEGYKLDRGLGRDLEDVDLG